MSRRKMWQWHAIEIAMALFLVLLIAGEVSAYIYSPLQSTSFGSNSVINEKDTTFGVFYHNKVSDFSKPVIKPVIYGLNSQNKQNDETSHAPEPKKDKQNDDTKSALEPKKDKQNDGTNHALEPKKDKQNDDTKSAPEPKKDKQNDGTNNAPEPKKDKQNDGTNSAPEPKKDKQNDGTNHALEPKKDKQNDDTIYLISNGSISGYKINDTNNNGIWDVGENAIEGGDIRLIGLAGIKIKNETLTDKNGFYAFTGLPEGGYIVKEEEQMGWKHTNSTVKKIELKNDEKSINNNFTNMLKKSQPVGTGSISGYKINDINGNGRWNEGEVNIPGWKIFLIGQAKNHKKNNEENDHEYEGVEGFLDHENIKPLWSANFLRKGRGNIKLETETNENGYYEFTDLPDGKYIVREKMKNDWVHTSSVVKHIEIEDGGIIRNVNFTNKLKIHTDNQHPDIPYIISGYKINDSDGTGISGWTIILTNETIIRTTNTDQNGFYKFTGISNGSYTVTEETRDGWTNITPRIINIHISGQNYTNQNFTNKLDQTSSYDIPYIISGYKKNYSDGTGISGWTITLTNETISRTAYTDQNGFYKFTGISNGSYTVTEETRDGWTNITPRIINIHISGQNYTNQNFTNKLDQTSSYDIPYIISGYKKNYSDGTGISGWTITLTNETISRTAYTDQNGFYKFTGISNGSYTVTEETRNGWTNITPRIINIHISGQNYTNQNFTNKLNESSLSLSITTSGSSSCGRYVSTKEKYSNIKQHEYSKEIYVYKSTSSIAFSFHTLGIVTEAGFIPKTNEGCITALGEILKGRPSFATIDVPYKDATYFNVWAGPTGYSESSKVEKQYLVFKKSDVKDDEIVKLMMYRDGAWIEAMTEKLSEGTYKAYTQGFGGFAIVKTQAPAMTTSQPAAAASDISGENKGMEPVNLALIIGVFLVIAIGVIYYLKIR